MATVLTAHDASPRFDSLRALDRLNFFLAAMQAGFGPFVAIHLADQGWTPESIGFVLSAGGLAGLLAQVPTGELLDVVQSKRMLVGAGSVAVALGALILALWPYFPDVLAASIIQGSTGGVLGLGVAAITLGLVGHKAAAERFGRNQRFSSIGSLCAAGLMGVIGYFLPTRDIFLAAALFAVPVLLSLAMIHRPDIHFGRSCGAPDCDTTRPSRVRRKSLFRDRRVLVFAGCLFLFQLANASILPLAGETLAHAEGRQSSLVLSALIIAPQIIVALLAPWAGRTANSWGRRPLLLLGLGMVPIRALFFGTVTDPALLVAVQALDGITGATLGVMTALVAADITNGTGRFNLLQGLIGTLSGIGASLSTSLSGFAVQRFGHTAGFLGVAAVALAAVVLLWALMPETKLPDAAQPPRSRRRRRRS
ncbi:MAG TPA: MFS transporter [Stellaceae bacterium]|nr:MFS transporter [Stellaceae bacterium]